MEKCKQKCGDAEVKRLTLHDFACPVFEYFTAASIPAWVDFWENDA